MSEDKVEVKWEGKEVLVNPTPPQRAARNLGRIGRLEASMTKMVARGERGTMRYEKFRRELTWRKLNQDMITLRGGQ